MNANGSLAPINEPRWSRYHLLPQLGLTLFVCGGLPAWAGTRFRLRPDGGLTRRQVATLGGLLVVCFLIQMPRGLIGANSSYGFSDQMTALRRIEAVDACCREQHIGADQRGGVWAPWTFRGRSAASMVGSFCAAVPIRWSGRRTRCADCWRVATDAACRLRETASVIGLTCPYRCHP